MFPEETISGSFTLLSSEDPDLRLDHSPRKLYFRQRRLSTGAVSVLWVTFFFIVVFITGGTVYQKTNVHQRLKSGDKVPNFPVILQKFDLDESFFGISSPRTDAAWLSIMPEGKGFVRLAGAKSLSENVEEGSEIFCLSVFHQLHCLNLLRTAYYSLLHPSAGHSAHSNTDNTSEHHSGHMDHCFEYLRQSLMCAGDTSLESKDEVHQGVQGWGVTHKCRNYEAIVDWTERHRSNDNYGIE